MPEAVKFYSGIVLVGNMGHGAVTGDYPPRLALLREAVDCFVGSNNPAPFIVAIVAGLDSASLDSAAVGFRREPGNFQAALLGNIASAPTPGGCASEDGSINSGLAAKRDGVGQIRQIPATAPISV